MEKITLEDSLRLNQKFTHVAFMMNAIMSAQTKILINNASALSKEDMLSIVEISTQMQEIEQELAGINQFINKYTEESNHEPTKRNVSNDNGRG